MKRLSWLCLGLLTLLLGCLPQFDGGDPAQSPSGLRPSQTQLEPSALVSATSGAPLIVEEQGNCPVDEVEIPGEGARVRGSIGGLAIAPNPVGITPGRARDLGQRIADIAAPSLEQPTALIVVDDFNGTAEQDGVYYLDRQDGPKLADLRTGATEAEVQGLKDARQYSHGALVFNHTLALLSALDPNPEVSGVRVSVPEEDAVISLPVIVFTKLRVSVVALDTEDFRTDIIAQRLQATIRALAGFGSARAFVAQQQQAITRVAVNMSFGLVPCSVLADIEGAESLTFEAYAQDVLDANGLDAGTFRDDLVNILTTPVGSDPLLGVAASSLESPAETLEISYLAAAGNYRMPFALFPGYWSEFVSVSARNLASAVDEKDPDYSNTGEVLLGGGYFTLTAYDPARGWLEYPNLSIAGTSFAAPVLSVFTALDFTNATPRCTRSPGDIASPLAFFKTDPPVALPTPDLNVPLVDALNRYCASS